MPGQTYAAQRELSRLARLLRTTMNYQMPFVLSHGKTIGRLGFLNFGVPPSTIRVAVSDGAGF